MQITYAEVEKVLRGHKSEKITAAWYGQRVGGKKFIKFRLAEDTRTFRILGTKIQVREAYSAREERWANL